MEINSKNKLTVNRENIKMIIEKFLNKKSSLAIAAFLAVSSASATASVGNITKDVVLSLEVPYEDFAIDGSFWDSNIDLNIDADGKLVPYTNSFSITAPASSSVTAALVGDTHLRSTGNSYNMAVSMGEDPAADDVDLTYVPQEVAEGIGSAAVTRYIKVTTEDDTEIESGSYSAAIGIEFSTTL